MFYAHRSPGKSVSLHRTFCFGALLAIHEHLITTACLDDLVAYVKLHGSVNGRCDITPVLGDKRKPRQINVSERKQMQIDHRNKLMGKY